MQSSSVTVADYLASLPEDCRHMVEAVRKVILDNLDIGYSELMQYGMIGYSVPHSVFPAGYHCDPKQPLPFAGIASQKNYVSVYLMGLYCGCTGDGETSDEQWFRDAWAASGKQKLDMGKACVRFKKLEDVALGNTTPAGDAIYRALPEGTRGHREGRQPQVNCVSFYPARGPSNRNIRPMPTIKAASSENTIRGIRTPSGIFMALPSRRCHVASARRHRTGP